MSEKRMFERVMAPVKIKYSLYGDGSGSGESRDISGGGIRLSLMEKLEEGTLLSLRFEIPGVPEEIQIQGKVVWAREVIISGKDERVYYDTGINFFEDNPLKLGKIFEYFRESTGKKIHDK